MNELTNEKAIQPVVVPGFTSAAAIQQLQYVTDIFNKSSMVPVQYQGPNNRGNCAIVIAMAARWGADPLMMLQNVYVVHGTPALSSKMMIALFNTCGRYESIHYKETGEKGTDSQGVIAWTREKKNGSVLRGPEVTIAIAKAEGWYQKNGSKWKTIPDQMLRYRAAAWFIRTTAPELSLGLQSVEEAEDIAKGAGMEAPQPFEEAVKTAAKEPPKELPEAPGPTPFDAPEQPAAAPAADNGPTF